MPGEFAAVVIIAARKDRMQDKYINPSLDVVARAEKVLGLAVSLIVVVLSPTRLTPYPRGASNSA